MFIIRKILGVIFGVAKLFSRKGLYPFLDAEIGEVKIGGKVKVLNVGAGGEIAARLKELDHAEVLSIDVDEERKPDLVMDVTNLTFPDCQFDVVFIIEVLEHVKEPQMATNEILRVLKPGGRLVLTTPFMLGIHDRPYDFYRYTSYGLSWLLRDFDKVDIKERNSYWDSVVVLPLRLLMANAVFDRIIGLLFLFVAVILFPVNYLISKLIRSNYSTTGYVCVAFKSK